MLLLGSPIFFTVTRSESLSMVPGLQYTGTVSTVEPVLWVLSCSVAPRNAQDLSNVRKLDLRREGRSKLVYSLGRVFASGVNNSCKTPEHRHVATWSVQQTHAAGQQAIGQYLQLNWLKSASNSE